MGRGEVQREMRVPAAVIAQRPAQRAAAGPDRGVEVRPVVGAQPGPGLLFRIAPLGEPPGQLTQETLPAGVALVAPATLVPSQERAV